MLQHIDVYDNNSIGNTLHSISTYSGTGTQCQSTKNTGSPRHGSRDSSVTFSHTMCVVAQVTQLVLAELCDALQAGHQHVVHV